MKKKRHEKIVEFIEKFDIETQEELARRLKEAGFNVTQTTISRDIRELKLSKVPVKGAIANNYMKNPLGKWAIELKAEHKLIGDIHFVKISEKNQSAEIGYVLNQNYWNQGLLTEALKVLTEFSFEQFALKKLELLIDKENPASKKVALKSGYQMVKKFKGSNQYSAKIRNFEQYEQRKNDYEIYRKKSEIGEI